MILPEEADWDSLLSGAVSNRWAGAFMRSMLREEDWP
jgi:hypothetical protein